MDRLGSLVVIAPAHRAGDPGLNPRKGENFSPKLLIPFTFLYNCPGPMELLFKAYILELQDDAHGGGTCCQCS